MRLGGFTIESLQSRREAAAVDVALGLLSGGVYGEPKSYKPTKMQPSSLTRKRTRYTIEAGTQLKSNTKVSSLDTYKHTYLGSIHKISLTFYVLYRFFTSIFKTTEPLLRGQSAGGGVESAIKTIAYHSLSPSFSAMKTQKLAPSPCLSSQKSRWPKWRVNNLIV